MSREKQIEEKLKIINNICPFYKEYGTCEQCNADLDIGDEPCYWECMAEAIIRYDYCKTSEVACEAIDEMRRMFKEEAFNPNNKFDFIIDTIDEIADQLKKKYAEVKG